MRVPTPMVDATPWPRQPAKALFLRRRRPPRDGDGVVTAFRDGEVTLRTNRRTEGFTNAIEEHGYQGVRRGDLVIHSMDGFAGAIGVSDSDGKASPVVHAYRPRSDVDPRYYAYLLRDLALHGFVTSLAKGIRERSTAFDSEAFRSLVLPVPPFMSQVAIADFLDAETARIDALIAKKRRLVELLDERYRDLVEMLTGVGVPVRVRHLTALITSGPRGWADQVGDVGDPFIRSANLRRESTELRRQNLLRVEVVPTREALRARVRAGDTVVGITGANTGWVGLVEDRDAPAYVSQHVAILRPAGVDPRWLAHSVFSRRSQEALLAGQYGGTKQQLGLADLADLSVHVPPAEEQARLVALLDAARERHASLVSALQRQVDLLVEHRQALVTGVVTGALVVPGVAA